VVLTAAGLLVQHLFAAGADLFALLLPQAAQQPLQRAASPSPRLAGLPEDKRLAVELVKEMYFKYALSKAVSAAESSF
jgi:hypothetical protein